MSESGNRRTFLLGGAVAAAALPASAAGPVGQTSIYNVRDFDAGKIRGMETPRIQAAINTCADAGGGTVYFPAGDYPCGGLRLRSGVHLYLDAGATIFGSKKLEDFPVTTPKIRSYTDNYTERSLIYGEGLRNVGIHGDGVLDGQGAAYEGPYKVRPYMIRLVSCTRVSVTGITIRDSPMWVQHYLACDDVHIHGITVHSRVNANNDGIDIDGCHRVTISDCNISSGDDAIVLKSTLDRRTSSVAITNCLLSSQCNAFKIGTESNGGFEDIVLSNCTIYDTRLSGIALEMVDGGVLDGVNISNITMRDVKSPIFIRLGNRARPFSDSGPRPGVGTLTNVTISNVKATGASSIGCPISGIPNHKIRNLLIENVRIRFEGGVKDSPPDVPENESGYPEHKMFGTLPAYGFFCRHVDGIRLSNVETEVDEADARPAVVCYDVENLDIASSSFAGQGATIRLRDANGVMVHSCRAREEAEVFLDLSGGGVKNACLIGNDLGRVNKAVSGGDLFQQANRT